MKIGAGIRLLQQGQRASRAGFGTFHVGFAVGIDDLIEDVAILANGVTGIVIRDDDGQVTAEVGLYFHLGLLWTAFGDWVKCKRATLLQE